MHNEIQKAPWEAEDAFPLKPEGSEYGYLRARKATPCSREELIEKCRRADRGRIRLVWVPEFPRLVPPSEVSFLREALHAGALARVEERIRWLMFMSVAWGLWALAGSPRARPLIISLVVLTGILPLIRAVRTRRVLRSSPPEAMAGIAADSRFATWLAGRKMRVTWILLACIAGAQIWQLAVGIDVSLYAAGFVKPLVREGEYWRLMTGALLHANLLHFTLNALALATLGWLTEALAGRARLAATYVVACLAGSCCSYFLSPHSLSVGASGGIVGLLGFLAVLVVRHRGALPKSLGRWVFGTIVVVALSGIAGHQIIDNAGHAGGFVGGAMMGVLFLRKRPSVVPPAPGRAWRIAEWVFAALLLISTGAMVIKAGDESTGWTGAYSRAHGHLERGESEAAIRSFDAILELNPEYPPALVGRGYARMQQGDYEGAQRDYTEALRLNAGDVDTLINRAWARRHLENFEGAREDLDHAIRRDSRSVLALRQRASLRWHLENLEGARDDYDAALKVEPRNLEALTDRGVLRLSLDDLDGALADLDKSLEIDPKNARNLVWRAWVRFLRNEHDAALADCERALALKPDDAYAINTRGLARYGKGDVDGAIRDYSESIRLAPRHDYAYSNRGDARRGKSDLPGALADYAEALKLNAEDPESLLGRGLVRRDQGDLAGAKADFEAALKAAHRWWTRRGEAEEAIRSLEKKK